MDLDQLDIKGKSDGPVLSALRDEPGLPREVYALLAQANLLRMRGCWEEAVSSCMSALRLAPDSPSAQSLLGDIYENQGRFDDAIQWYRMALDANSDSPADRLKLDRLLQKQLPTPRAERKFVEAPSVMEAGATAFSAPLPPRRLPLLRLMQDPETALRCGALAAAALVCLVVVFAYAAVHRRAALASLGLGPSQEVQAAPVVVAPATGLPADAALTDTAQDSAELAVLTTLRSSSDLSAQGIAVDEVQFDPRAARMSLTISLTAGDGLTRGAVLRSALHTIEAAAAASPSATDFTIRSLMIPGTGGGATLIFVGDVSQSALPGSGAAEPDDDHVAALFTNPWWSSQLPS